MTREEAEEAVTELRMVNAPEIVVRAAADLLLTCGWSKEDFGALLMKVAETAEVVNTLAEAEKILAEDAMLAKPKKVN